MSINKAIACSKKGKVGSAHASAQERGGSSKAREVGAETTEELALGIGATVGERALGELPDALVGIELRGIAREAVEVEPRIAGLERANRLAAVDGAVVPDHDHGTAEMAEQIPEEGAHLGVLEVLGREQEVEAAAPAARTYGQTRDDGDALAPLAVAQERGLTPRRPGAAHAWDQEEPRLVDEDEVGAQPRGFFWMRGQDCRFQCSMRSSLRSSARRSGFCTLQPNACSRRPTCAR